MLSCEKLTVRAGKNGPCILDKATCAFMPGALNAVIGPSGCGKTTLVKALLGILPSEGTMCHRGTPIARSEDLTGQVGFAPQFSIAHENLTVEECLRYALDLCVRPADEKRRRLDAILLTIGLEAHRHKRVRSLSGGQLRRLGLGIELAPDPACLICDEVTSGLDPLSEDQILQLLRHLCHEQGKTFINIIHNLGKLPLFDFVTVVYQGDVVYQGSPQELLEWFGIDDPLRLYDRLNEHPLEHWRAHWQAQAASGTSFTYPPPPAPTPAPSGCAQLLTLLNRRTRLFFRDRGFLLLTLGITLGFPFLVVIFALGGLPQIEGLSLDQSQMGAVELLRGQVEYRLQAARTASLVTGLVMFQVILLTLIGSNNGAREIAAERTLYEKERLNGLRPWAYAAAKITFASALAVSQGLVMTLLVKYLCVFPGPLLPQMLTLCLCCASMTFVCLGFSALLASPEKASSLSIYLVGFQLPLSGVVLALPDYLVWVCRPFINAYWSWAGYIGTMRDTRFYDTLQDAAPLWIPQPALAQAILALQATAGLLMVFWGCHRKRWT